ncbi:MAG: SIS domain-containing protein [Xanthomonadaceae bacterium]|nr:SIS domain-containing protein [Xanthomonadaceae bacterium]
MPATEFFGIAADTLHARGALHTAREICQQPAMLEATQALLATLRVQLDAFAQPVTGNPRARVILTGAGTSAYIGQILAPLLDRQLAARVDAVASTDLVSAPRLHLDAGQPLLLVSFGRSGNSPESLAAVALAEALVDDVRHLFITCNPDGKLGQLAMRQACTLHLPEATHDASFAMTSSFSCMLYAALAALGTATDLATRNAALAQATQAVIGTHAPALQALAGRGFDRCVSLGSGVLQGLAREAALKLGELSNGAVASCHETPLGFRHGPKTFITGNTLVLVFVSNDAHTRRYDHDLIDELRRDGEAGAVLEISAHPRTGNAAHTLAVPGMAQAQDIDLVWPYVAIAQCFAFFTALALGRSPDNPNPQGTVNRVVQGVTLYPLEA